MAGEGRKCADLLWCCGNLQTAAITVGVSDIIFLLLATGHFIELNWNQPFGLHLVAFCLVVLFLLASSGLLLHGIVKKHCWLLLPWMVLHLGAILGSVILCSIQFQAMNQWRALLLIGAAIQIYYFLLVFLHYMELREQPRPWDSGRPQPEGQDLTDLPSEQPKNDCLIDLELEEKADHDDSKDDTFTQLANSRGGVNNGCIILPTPDEVISLENVSPSASTSKETTAVEASSSNPSVIPRRSTTWKSAATLGSIEAAAEPLLLPPAKSDSKIAHVDNNFSPFRSKNAAQNGPKMKVFLPSAEDSDEDDEDDNSSADGQEET